jgi:hypothetical protein
MATSFAKVKKLFVNCHGNNPSDFDLDYPVWNDVDKAIRSLDGNSRDQVILIIDEGHSLLIGGGENGVYCCETELPHGQFILADPSKSKEKTVTIMSGQPGEYVESHTVDMNAILGAAKRFFDHGDNLMSLTWERI